MSVQQNVQIVKDVRNGKMTNVREYIDTLVLARAFEMAASTSA